MLLIRTWMGWFSLCVGVMRSRLVIGALGLHPDAVRRFLWVDAALSCLRCIASQQMGLGATKYVPMVQLGPCWGFPHRAASKQSIGLAPPLVGGVQACCASPRGCAACVSWRRHVCLLG